MKFQHDRLVRGLVIPTSLLCSVVLAWAGWSSLETIQNQKDIASLTASVSDIRDYTRETRDDVRKGLGINVPLIEYSSTTQSYAKSNE
jgi:hypothetical protein